MIGDCAVTQEHVGTALRDVWHPAPRARPSRRSGSTVSERGRGLYGDARAAASVLAALGAPMPAAAVARQEQPMPPVYRGRCGNRAAPRDTSGGCPDEVAPPPNPLRLCAECLGKYQAAGASVRIIRAEPSTTSFVLVPTHECPLDPGTVARISQNKDLILDLNPCGIVEASGAAKCAERRVFIRCDCHRHPDRPTRGHDTCQKCRTVGYIIVERIPTVCGASFALDLHGQRVQI